MKQVYFSVLAVHWKSWLLSQFPDGQWSFGWILLIILWWISFLIIVFSLNVADGKPWHGGRR